MAALAEALEATAATEVSAVRVADGTDAADGPKIRKQIHHLNLIFLLGIQTWQ